MKRKTRIFIRVVFNWFSQTQDNFKEIYHIERLKAINATLKVHRYYYRYFSKEVLTISIIY